MPEDFISSSAIRSSWPTALSTAFAGSGIAGTRGGGTSAFTVGAVDVEVGVLGVVLSHPAIAATSSPTHTVLATAVITTATLWG
jgi:hypothetical protein